MFFWMMVVEEATIVLVCPPIEEVVWWTSWARPRHSSLHDNVEMTAITGGTSAEKGRTNAKKGRTSASAGASGAMQMQQQADKSKTRRGQSSKHSRTQLTNIFANATTTTQC